jgi:DNA-binding MarR family transcriptional regulator
MKRSQRIRAVLRALYKKDADMRGAQTRVAEHFGVTRQNVSQIARLLKAGR